MIRVVQSLVRFEGRPVRDFGPAASLVRGLPLRWCGAAAVRAGALDLATRVL